jgi:hypothetical protein
VGVIVVLDNDSVTITEEFFHYFLIFLGSLGKRGVAGAGTRPFAKKLLIWDSHTETITVSERGIRLVLKAASTLGASKHDALDAIQNWLQSTKPKNQKRKK